jgi:hypothetical protein
MHPIGPNPIFPIARARFSRRPEPHFPGGLDPIFPATPPRQGRTAPTPDFWCRTRFLVSAQGTLTHARGWATHAHTRGPAPGRGRPPADAEGGEADRGPRTPQDGPGRSGTYPRPTPGPRIAPGASQGPCRACLGPGRGPRPHPRKRAMPFRRPLGGRHATLGPGWSNHTTRPPGGPPRGSQTPSRERQAVSFPRESTPARS